MAMNRGAVMNMYDAPRRTNHMKIISRVEADKKGI